ncbi:MAG TPA: HAMP domain-containing sensor histidine kinase [Micromonosporaceae bacterium]
MSSSLRAFAHRYWVEALWAVWVAANATAVVVVSEWATVPFHFIWIGITLLYGWRVWGLTATWVWLGVVVLSTGLSLTYDVFLGDQPVDELTEIPLMATVFLAMVWYVRRHVQAREQARVVSERNLELLEQQRRLIQDASHVLRTPLTIAMGHAELLLRDPTGPAVVDDVHVIIGQLRRLKTISDRLIALAGSERPDFLVVVETSVSDLITQAGARWFPTTSRVRLGTVVDELVRVDPGRIADAIDELVSNALEHTPAAGSVTLTARRDRDCVVVAVADQGPGVPTEDQERIFERFGRTVQADEHNGLGLGLALVRAIAEAHGGRVSVRNATTAGAVFELRLPRLASTVQCLEPAAAVSQAVQLSPGSGR